MIESGRQPPCWSNPLTFRLDNGPGATESTCRCGVHLIAGRRGFTACPGSETLRPIFSHERFCSLLCLRAFALETLEDLVRCPRPESQNQWWDLRELVLDLAEVWAALQRDYPRGTAS
jgi:hypothetical protein